MDNIKVNIRTLNKRTIQRILRNEQIDHSSRDTPKHLQDRSKMLQHRPQSKKCSGMTLQDYIRGSSPSSTQSPSQIVKIGFREMRLNFPRQPQIQEIDQDNYDESSVNKIIDVSLPKIQGFGNSITKKSKFRSCSRTDSSNDSSSKIRLSRMRTTYNELKFFNLHQSVSGKKSMRETIYSSSLGQNNRMQKHIKFHDESPYLGTSVGFLMCQKKRSRRTTKTQN